LYYQFDNKEALGHAVVDEIVASLTREKWVRPLQNATNPHRHFDPEWSKN
jgi:AcrR family transcriptional regulator